MPNLHDLIKKAIVLGVQSNADRIFQISQDTEGCFVPVNTGFLKQSGRVVNLNDGASIQYKADYASEIEYGTPGESWSGTQEVRTRSHKRKGYLRKDGTYVNPHTVQAHTKRYENQRLIGFRPKAGEKFKSNQKIYRVMGAKNATEGQFFLTRAVKEGLTFLSADLEIELKRLEQQGNISL